MTPIWLKTPRYEIVSGGKIAADKLQLSQPLCISPTLMIRSHRGRLAAALIAGVKRRLLLPGLRWLFEYNQNNFLRQQRVNDVLFACVQQLAIENAALRRDLERRQPPTP